MGTGIPLDVGAIRLPDALSRSTGALRADRCCSVLCLLCDDRRARQNDVPRADRCCSVFLALQCALLVVVVVYGHDMEEPHTREQQYSSSYGLGQL